MASAKLSRKNELQNYAKMRINTYNSLIAQINEVVNTELTPEQRNQLSYLLTRLETADQLSDSAWERYVDYCENNDYKITYFEVAK